MSDKAQTVTAIIAALDLAEALFPRLQELVAKGEVSAEQQLEVFNRAEALREKVTSRNRPSHWDVKPIVDPSDVKDEIPANTPAPGEVRNPDDVGRS